MSQNRMAVSIYDAKFFGPALISIVFMLGLFQNCSSSEFTGKKGEEKVVAQDARPIEMGGSVDIVRLEGRPLSLIAPEGLFSDQGLEFCKGAKYTWSFQPVASGATPITLKETSRLLEIEQVKLSDEGAYYLVVTCNGQEYNLGPANLDVVSKLRLVNSNVNNQTINEGSSTTLSANFSGPANITYKWFFTPESGGEKVALAGQTSEELVITEAKLSDQGYYELVATSNEKGIHQSLSAGPGRLTVLPISAVAGSVSGTTTVEEGQPIELTSTLSGATSPTYQWYFNGVKIDGANQPNFSIPVSAYSDSGTYSLVVSDRGEDYQIGSINVVVVCPIGQQRVGNTCVANTKSCTVPNGTGIQFLNSAGTYDECTVTNCDQGYVNYNNKCVKSEGTCPITNGTGKFTYGPNGPGECIVSTCNDGYTNVNNKCEPATCDVENGTGRLYLENGSLVCKVEYCEPDYVKYGGKCIPRYESCSVSNGIGKKENTESGPGECKVTTCNAGYVNINNSCVKKECSVSNGQGVISLAPNGAIQCQAVSCNPGYFLMNNQCVSQQCETAIGHGTWTQSSGQNVCSLTSCKTAGHVVINNQCVNSSCPIENGTGALAINASGGTYCKAVSCNSGYVIKGDICEPGAGLPCAITNGTGQTGSDGKTCLVSSCNSGYIAYNNQCVKQTVSCSVTNGTGTITYTPNGPGQCVVTSCNSGYQLQNNQCVPTRRQCPVENGIGYQTAYSNGYGECIVESCDPGYGVTISQLCLPEKRRCHVGSGSGWQYLYPYGYSSCQIEECGAGETLIMGACRQNERLYCEPTDKNLSAYGGKVFGHIFSLVQNKSNVNINTATQMSKRMNGFVYLNKVFISHSDSYLYDTTDTVIRHPSNLENVKNWYGLALYTQVLTPDGASSGQYIFALASDDGSALDCKVNGSWVNYINNGNGNACSDIKAAQNPITISASKPLPIKVRYFQNASGGRCLKLLYKRVGDANFKVVPKERLILPDQTINNCPQ